MYLGKIVLFGMLTSFWEHFPFSRSRRWVTQKNIIARHDIKRILRLNQNKTQRQSGRTMNMYEDLYVLEINIGFL